MSAQTATAKKQAKGIQEKYSEARSLIRSLVRSLARCYLLQLHVARRGLYAPQHQVNTLFFSIFIALSYNPNAWRID